MRLRYPFLLALAAMLFAPMASAQTIADILINEVDADQTGTDAAEFVELYNPTGSAIALDGAALGFYNGNGEALYLSAALDGYTVPAGGYFVFCGDAANVANCDFEIGAGTTNLIQNGADGVALFNGNPPADATTTGLIDALVYGTNDDDDTDLLTALGESVQYNDTTTESIQRSPDGAEAYTAAAPTPGAANALPSETFAGYLLGANEVPAVTTDAAGAVTAVLTGTELQLTGRFGGLSGDFTGSHLHEAPAGTNGGVFVTLAPTLDGNSGTFDETHTLTADQAAAVRAGNVYVNVHTSTNPGGEIRAQLLVAPDAPSVTLQQARYIGAGYSVAVSGTVTRAMGDFTYFQDETGGLAIRQTFGAFFDEVAAGTITGGSTLDVTGELSEFGSLLQISNTDLASYSVTGSTAIPDAQEISLVVFAADAEPLEGMLVTVTGATFAETGAFAASTSYTIDDGGGTGEVYVDGAEETAIVGVEIPAGPADVTGIMSQSDFDSPFTDGYRILPILADDVVPGEEEFAGYLLGANEVPAVATGAAGAVAVQLIGTELEIVGRFGGLDGDYTASHLHEGAAGANGAPFVTLAPTLNADNRGGTFDQTITLTAEQAAALRAGNVYVNVHTTANTGGEIRAQLEADPDIEEVTLRQARYIGAGFPVTVSGTVSRAMGAFTYFQDATGGLVVRQTSGDFFDAVGSGAITTGTTLDVTGELSEFRALLQINEGDLEDYTITGSTAAPTPVEVTLADIAASGEDYESELVTIRAITFADAGGTFAAGTNYDVDDGTGGAVQVRVIGGNDTDVDGTAIPGGNSNVTGVLGQFDRDAPFTDGYQVQPILATDVQVATANEEGVLRTGAMLAVENPARGAVSVRFDAGTSGRATLTVFDMVGRQVAVLAAGDVPAGERTATLDAGALASGVYVVRLDVESGTLTRVVTVVR